jgi:hypothetical protein
MIGQVTPQLRVVQGSINARVSSCRATWRPTSRCSIAASRSARNAAGLPQERSTPYESRRWTCSSHSPACTRRRAALTRTVRTSPTGVGRRRTSTTRPRQLGIPVQTAVPGCGTHVARSHPVAAVPYGSIWTHGHAAGRAFPRERPLLPRCDGSLRLAATRAQPPSIGRYAGGQQSRSAPVQACSSEHREAS